MVTFRNNSNNSRRNNFRRNDRNFKSNEKDRNEVQISKTTILREKLLKK